MLTLTQDQFNRLNVIALTVLRETDEKAYDEVCEILSEVYKTDIAESEECAKEVPVVSLLSEDDSVCPRDCSVRGDHRHTNAF